MVDLAALFLLVWIGLLLTMFGFQLLVVNVTALKCTYCTIFIGKLIILILNVFMLWGCSASCFHAFVRHCNSYDNVNTLTNLNTSVTEQHHRDIYLPLNKRNV